MALLGARRALLSASAGTLAGAQGLFIDGLQGGGSVARQQRPVVLGHIEGIGDLEGVTVEIFLKRGDGEFESAGTALTDADGAFSFELPDLYDTLIDETYVIDGQAVLTVGTAAPKLITIAAPPPPDHPYNIPAVVGGFG